MRICAYAHTNPPYPFSPYIRTFVIPNSTPPAPGQNSFFKKYRAENPKIQKTVRMTNNPASSKLSYTPLKTTAANSSIVVKP